MGKIRKKVSKDGKNALEKIKAKFNSKWVEFLDFEVDDQNYIIKPKKYLGANMFYELSARIHRLDGFYVSAGKNSHFKIPK